MPFTWVDSRGSRRFDADTVKRYNTKAYQYLLGEKLGAKVGDYTFRGVKAIDDYLTSRKRSAPAPRGPLRFDPPAKRRRYDAGFIVKQPTRTARAALMGPKLRRMKLAGPRVKRLQAVRGRYVGPFSRLKNRRGYDKFRVLGSTNKVEVTGNSVGAEVAEIGHSVCVPQLIMQSVGRAIFRRLWHNTTLTDWNETASPTSATFYYQILYRTDPSSSVISFSVVTNFAATLTYSQMADTVMNGILAVITTTNEVPMFEEIKFFKGSSSPATCDDLTTINLRQSSVILSVLSVLTVQNITESATGGTEDHTQVTDVRANPVLGRCWQSNSNTFIPVAGSTTFGVGEGFTSNIADDRYGQVGDITGNMTYDKPPNFYQNAKRSGQVMLQPGQIKKSVLNHYKKYSFNRIIRIFSRWCARNTSVTASGTSVYVPFGPSKLMHFEHMVKNSGDPSVSLGYEIDLFVKSYMLYRNKREALRIDGI